MIVQIKSTEKEFFRQYLELLRTVSPLNNLRNRELDLLGEIMYQRYKYKALAIDGALDQFIFSVSMRRKMRDNINMTEATYNNNLSIIKKHGIISNEFKLMKALDLDPGKEFNITFKFHLDNKEDGDT